MRVLHVMLAALAVAVVVTSVASATGDATKQRVQIDTKISGKGWAFVLTPLEAGALERDSGTQSCVRDLPDRTVRRDGQDAFLGGCRAATFVGKRGTLVLHSQNTWLEAGGPYNINVGTWKVVRGTGQYARVAGSGRSAGLGNPETGMSMVRFQGFLTSK